MAFAKGNKLAGSRKGKPNKATAPLKEMILNALNKAGGEDYLYERAMEDPSLFCALLGKVIPLQHVGPGEDGEHVVSIVRKIIDTRK